MGVRFACHRCGKPLNIKDALAGKRGKCPGCGTRFRIPIRDQDFSIPLESDQAAGAQSAAVSHRTAQAPTAQAPTANSGGAETVDAETVGAVADGATELGTGVRERAADASAGVADVPIDFDPLEDSRAQWYVRPPAGGRFGPANGETIRQWIAEGRITPATLLWREEWPQWREFSDVMPEAIPVNSSASVRAGPVSEKTLPIAPAGIAAAATGRGEAVALAPGGPTVAAAPRPAAPYDPESYLGAKKRRKAKRRMMAIAILVATALVLVAALVAALIL